MISPKSWVLGKIKDFLFYQAYKRAPIKQLGDIHVKEVQGNLYMVDIEVIPPKVTHD